MVLHGGFDLLVGVLRVNRYPCSYCFTVPKHKLDLVKSVCAKVSRKFDLVLPTCRVASCVRVRAKLVIIEVWVGDHDCAASVVANLDYDDEGIVAAPTKRSKEEVEISNTVLRPKQKYCTRNG